MTSKTLFLILAVLITLVGCDSFENQKNNNKSSELPEGFDLGKVRGNWYHQRYLGLELFFDSTWAVQSQEQMEQIQKSAEDFIEDEELKKIMKASDVTTANLFTAFKYEIGSAVDFNPSIMVMAENLSHAPGIKNGEDYLFHVKKLLKQASSQYQVEDEILHKKINDKTFDIMKVKLTTQGIELTQEYLIFIKRGFCLAFIISYTNDEDKNELYSFLDKTKV